MMDVAGILLAYLIGSVSGSMLLGTLRGVDIRTMGSGNAGGTNALRTQGWQFALGVVAIDIAKGWAAAWLAGRYFADTLQPQWLVSVAAMAAILGHMFPIYHRFRGGKGAATYIGALVAISPLLIAPIFAVWLITLLATGYVSLATMLAALSGPVLGLLMARPDPVVWFAVGSAVMIVLAHWSNIRRLRAGVENRFEKVRILRGTSEDNE